MPASESAAHKSLVRDRCINDDVINRQTSESAGGDISGLQMVIVVRISRNSSHAKFAAASGFLDNKFCPVTLHD